LGLKWKDFNIVDCHHIIKNKIAQLKNSIGL
jgi:hypothetical protein